MKKFNFEAKIEGIITIKDDSMSNDDVLNDLKHEELKKLYSTLKNAN